VFPHLRTYLAATAVFLGASAAVDVSAELVFLENGRHLSVKSYRLDGDDIVLVLRQGGEIVCARSMVKSIAPDEVPYPEPMVEPEETEEPLAAVPFGDLIDAAASRHGVDVRLVRAVVQVESAYRPNARSRKGAKGLMQLMPQTARQYAVRNPYDPASNLDAGVKHLKLLLERFELALALAAYNAGEATVRRFGGIPPFQETRDYVRQVLGILQAPRSAL
jgi:soluble lytic murein transglycosylase-like protein